ncbi:COG2081 Predicted flavoproteins [Rhabdaerophilaceae bacterium]
MIETISLPPNAPVTSPPMVAIVGGGPSGLFAAERLASAGLAVQIFDRMPSLGRKFLLAGRGGLNLTHSEPLMPFLERYRGKKPWLAAPISGFTPDHLRAWADGLGQETFIGTSGRVFPRVMKASPLLRAWLRRLEALGVKVNLRHEWSGWRADGSLVFHTPSGEAACSPAASILALGGASWPKLGADGRWIDILGSRGVSIQPLAASNTGVLCAWSPRLRDHFAGAPIKSLALSLDGHRVAGEMIVTREGLEGGAIYALTALVRESLARQRSCVVHCDLRPEMGIASLVSRLAAGRKGDTTANRLRKAGLSPAAAALVQEYAVASGIRLAMMSVEELAGLIKALPLPIIGLAGLDRAISTAGGIRQEALNADFMLRALPGVFVAGEMLDWEAPTGGYLLQACFATAAAAAEGVLRYLKN